MEDCDPGRTQRAMEGQVREVRGEGEEGGRGDKRNKAHLIDTTGWGNMAMSRQRPALKNNN
jgi:hypothetical protein